MGGNGFENGGAKPKYNCISAIITAYRFAIAQCKRSWK
jgi:hypothetical protein